VPKMLHPDSEPGPGPDRVARAGPEVPAQNRVDRGRAHAGETRYERQRKSTIFDSSGKAAQNAGGQGGRSRSNATAQPARGRRPVDSTRGEIRAARPGGSQLAEAERRTMSILDEDRGRGDDEVPLGRSDHGASLPAGAPGAPPVAGLQRWPPGLPSAYIAFVERRVSHCTTAKEVRRTFSWLVLAPILALAIGTALILGVVIVAIGIAERLVAGVGGGLLGGLVGCGGAGSMIAFAVRARRSRRQGLRG
jgi:hypothetical protein